MHTPARQFTFATFSGGETNDILRQVFEQIGIVDFLHSLAEMELHMQDAVYKFNYIIVGDWMSLVATFALDRPNSQDANSISCWACGMTKGELDLSYSLYLFSRQPLCREYTHYQRSALPDIPLKTFRYCWMHGISNMLQNSLLLLYDHSPAKGALVSEIHRFATHWSYQSVSLRPKETKQAIRRLLLQNLSQIFDNTDSREIPWPVGPARVRMFTLSSRALVTMLLDAVRCFHDFAYARTPAAGAFRSLTQAAIAYQAAFAAFKKPLTPTGHFMCTHAVQFAEIDRTAFHTLQEGAEHKNKVDIGHSKHTIGPNYEYHTSRSGWQQMLERQVIFDQLLQDHPELDDSDKETRDLHRNSGFVEVPLVAGAPVDGID